MARINQEILDELVEDCSAGNDEYVVSKWIIKKYLQYLMIIF